jgi:alpha-methylacyl-CoA racemase
VSGAGASRGPLHGVVLLELGGMGAVPHLGMLLADLGATVVKFLGPGPSPARQWVTDRSKLLVSVDLKSAAGHDFAMSVVARSQLLIEGFRPGVIERLGLAPATLLQCQPALVIGRLTGWGTAGEYASLGGHDINYIALSGALGAIGPADSPAIPLNLIGDFAGGAQALCIGLLAALIDARTTGAGQVVEANMLAGAGHLMASTYGMLGAGAWTAERSKNLLDGGCPYYSTYRCADGEFVAVGAIEDKFFAGLVGLLGLDPGHEAVRDRTDRRAWPALSGLLERVFATRSRDDWCRDAMGYDACVSPVLSMDEAPAHPQGTANQNFLTVDGICQPAPHPRFSGHEPAVPAPPKVVESAEVSSILDELNR